MKNLPKPPFLCLITDRNKTCDRPITDIVQYAIDGGVNIVQIREKDLNNDELYEFSLKIKNVIQEQAILMINSNLKIALSSCADGLHLTENADPPKTFDNNQMLLSKAIHSSDINSIQNTKLIDLLVIGNIYKTSTHPNRKPKGIKIISELRDKTKIPYIAVGGINESNIEPIMKNGAHGVAVISAISESQNPKITTENIYNKLNQAWDRNEK
jgi:thiamine-phosphate pyrophosphorylase